MISINHYIILIKNKHKMSKICFLEDREFRLDIFGESNSVTFGYKKVLDKLI
jgi:hypothetical protein